MQERNFNIIPEGQTEVTIGNRRIAKNQDSFIIWDPRVFNYAGNHQLHQEIGRLAEDYGTKWIQVTADKLEEALAILDKYPETPEVSSE